MRSLPRTPWLGAWFPALLFASVSAQRPAGPASLPIDRHVVVAGLWSDARYNYAYWDGVRANWDSAFAAAVTAIDSKPAPNDVTFFRQLRRWGALLHDGQFEVLAPAGIAARIARPPIVLRSIEHRPFIMDYAVNDEMRIARPERLAEIVAVQGVSAELWIRDSILPEVAAATDSSRWERAVEHMLEGERGTALHLLLRLPGGEQRGASVTRSVALTMRWPLERPALEADTLPEGVIWIRINSLADPDVVAMFDRALGDAPREGLRHRGLILDLREATWTPSGREQGYAIISRLIDRPVLTSRWRTPQYRPAYAGPDAPDSSGAWLAAAADTIWPPVRRERLPFTGPVVILASARTSGAAEDLLAAFRNAHRGNIIGETSAGGTGQTLVDRLAAGWQVRFTVTRDAFADGTEFGHSGIVPEIHVATRVADVLAGCDAPLERARALLTATARR